MTTNIDGVFYAMRHQIPVMINQGGGIIINTASMLGSTGSAGSGVYSGTKHIDGQGRALGGMTAI